MTNFSKYIDYLKSFPSIGEEVDLIKAEFNRISKLSQKESYHKEIDKFLGVLDIAVDNLNVYSSTILAIISIYFPDNELNNLPEKIQKIKEGYKKITNPPFKVLAKNTNQYLDYILATAGDLRAVLIAIAEHAYHLQHLNEEYNSMKELIDFSEVVYIPLCHRLGFYSLKSQMEDLVLKNKNPEIYNHILGKLKESTEERESFIAKFIEPIQKEMADHKVKYRIKSRTKSVSSIYAKMKKQDISFEKVYDLFAIRIITNSTFQHEKADCWHIFSVVTNIYKPELKRLRDWISHPKDNGYESLHITVQGENKKFVEIQIRSERMDDEAENGLAAHWRYKGGKSDQQIDKYLQKIRKALENKSSYGDEVSYSAQNITKDIYAFTPTGELKKLKKGATVLDFAFAIHSEVGVRCSGARINGRQRPIKHSLANGDMVEILTSKHQRPTLDWLNFTSSTRAKSRIKKALDERRMNEANDGKEILLRRLRNWKITFNQSLLDLLVLKFNAKTITDLYQEIFLETIDLKEVKKIISDSYAPVEKENIESIKEEEITPSKSTSHDALVIDELDYINYKLAKCCNPVPGDRIFGFVTIARGITIHRNSCPNAKSMKERYPYRILPAQWKTKEEKENFRAVLFVEGANKEGILAEISKIITNHAVILSINLNTIGNNFQGKITLQINNHNQINQVINSLSAVKDITKVYRVGSGGKE